MKRILLMDDSQLFLQVTSSALRAAGYETQCVSDLAELEAARAQRTDLVLMDVQMPEAFGDDVAMILRDAHGVVAPIYLLSSLAEADLAERARWAGIEGYISKTAGLAAIVERVDQILRVER